MRIVKVELSKERKPKYRKCPKCGENAPYDIKRGFLEEDGSDSEMYTFKECRLCWFKDPHVPRNTKKRAARLLHSDKMNELMDQILSDNFK